VPVQSAATSTSDRVAELLEIDERALRSAFGRFATGVTIVTGMSGEESVGFTCQSFHSVSMSPPLVSIGVMASSTTYPRLRPSGRFGVCVLNAGQRDLAQRFARRGDDRWAGIAPAWTERGTPIVPGSIVAFDCAIEAEYTVGDHTLVIGRVDEILEAGDDLGPLVFFRSGFRGLEAEPLGS